MTLQDDEILGVMRSCHDRRLEREGIPMILGLADLRGTMPAGPERAQHEGARLVTVIDHYRETLAPWAADDDEGALILAMQVAAVTHFAPGARADEEARA